MGGWFVNTQRIDALLACIFLDALKSEDFTERSLGPIHFIKYIYLADLAYSEKHNGKIYTEIPWKFYHFGPWDAELWRSIAPSLNASGAVAENFPSDFSDTGYTRWTIQSREKITSVAQGLTIELRGVLSWAVKKFANHTPELLNYVYNTPPMLRAAPQEFLDFAPSGWSFNDDTFSQKKKIALTARQEKKITAWKKESALLLRNKIAEKRAQRSSCAPVPPPKYDSIYFEGLAALDAEMSSPLPEGKIKIFVQNDVWKSKARYDP